MSDSIHNNPDESPSSLQNDNITDKAESKTGIYDRLRKISTLDAATILQVDATVIVGVLFFLTLTTFLGSEERQARSLAVSLTIIAVLPFSASAMLLLWTFSTLRLEVTSFFLGKKGPRLLEKKDYKKIVRYSRNAVDITLTGFGYLLVVLIVVWLQTDFGHNIQTAEQDCGVDPERFGINESDIWQCSMFTKNSLAERCTINPSQFDKSLSECHEFIPPSDL
jgi:hypothetical protein